MKNKEEKNQGFLLNKPLKSYILIFKSIFANL